MHQKKKSVLPLDQLLSCFSNQQVFQAMKNRLFLDPDSLCEQLLTPLPPALLWGYTGQGSLLYYLASSVTGHKILLELFSDARMLPVLHRHVARLVSALTYLVDESSALDYLLTTVPGKAVIRLLLQYDALYEALQHSSKVPLAQKQEVEALCNKLLCDA